MSYTREWLQNKVFPEVDLTREASNEEVEEAIKSLNITDTAGHDNITTRLVKCMGGYIAPVMTHLINLCFEHDRMPVPVTRHWSVDSARTTFPQLRPRSQPV